jgi:hypothetical protein
MAEVEEIYQDITNAVAIDTALNTLDGSGESATQLKADLISNPSVVSRNRLIMWLVAMAMYAHRVLWGEFRQDVTDLAREGHYGTKRWWAAKALEYQFGDDLVFTDKDAFYDPVDESARVVQLSSIDVAAFKVIVKAASLDGAVVSKLTSEQLLGLQDYCEEIAPTGINVEARSVDPDRLRVSGRVICDAKQGIEGIKAMAGAAADDYLLNLDFNGVFSITKLRQAVLAVPGVIDIDFTSVEANSATQANYFAVTRVYKTFAGYMKMDASNSFIDSMEFFSSNV